MAESKKSVQVIPKQAREPEILNVSPKKGITASLLWVCFASSFLSMHYGYFIWVVYSPGVLLREYYDPGTFELIKHPKFKVLELAIIVSIVPLGGIFASVTAGFMADVIGRKGCFLIANISATTSAVLLSGKYFIIGIEFTFLASLFTGLSAGYILAIVPLYMGEVAPRNCRGRIVFIHQFCLNIGILIAQILGIEEFLGNSEGLPCLMAMGAILPLMQLFLLPFIPESPRYLMIHKKNEEQARKVLRMLRESDDVEDEIVELYQEDLAEGNNKNMTPLKVISTPSMRLPVITIVVLAAGSQLSGISVAYFSTERIFLLMITRQYLKFLNSGAILVMTFSVLIALYLVDYVGRRPLLLGSFAICIMTSVTLIVSLRFQNSVKALKYLSSAVLILFICAHDVGAAPIPHILTLELFSQSSRASAVVILGSVFWSINFVTGLTFYYMEIKLGNYSSVIFWPFCLATLVYIYRMVPETMMQSFPDIKKVMSSKSARRFRSRESRKKLNLNRSV